MIPYLQIGLFGLIGLLIRGPLGLVIGLLAGFVASLAFPAIVRRFRGGLLPRELRKEVAASFITASVDLVREAFPLVPPEKYQAAVETAIEHIHTTAARECLSLRMGDAFARRWMYYGVKQLCGRETNVHISNFYFELWLHIERSLYP